MTILSHGLDVACVSDVRMDPKRWFGRPNRKRTDFVVLHWTGGQGGYKTVYDTLVRRKLSVQFVLDKVAAWQLADLGAVCSHAKGWNDRSVGVEITGIGTSVAWKPGTALHRIHGTHYHVVPFTEDQIKRVGTLCHELCNILNLPRQVPAEAMFDGNHKTIAAAGFRGVLGHYHIDRKKIDPGPEIFRRLVADFGFVAV